MNSENKTTFLFLKCKKINTRIVDKNLVILYEKRTKTKRGQLEKKIRKQQKSVY